MTVSDTGQATIRDEHSTNGTFVNGDRVLPGTEVRLVDGDSVRLAADVTGEVSLPRQGIPGAFSSNGHRDPACTPRVLPSPPSLPGAWPGLLPVWAYEAAARRETIAASAP